MSCFWGDRTVLSCALRKMKFFLILLSLFPVLSFSNNSNVYGEEFVRLKLISGDTLLFPKKSLRKVAWGSAAKDVAYAIFLSGRGVEFREETEFDRPANGEVLHNAVYAEIKVDCPNFYRITECYNGKKYKDFNELFLFSKGLNSNEKYNIYSELKYKGYYKHNSVLFVFYSFGDNEDNLIYCSHLIRIPRCEVIFTAFERYKITIYFNYKFLDKWKEIKINVLNRFDKMRVS